jgi:hypothetical protein
MNCKRRITRDQSNRRAHGAIAVLVFGALLARSVSAETSFIVASTRGSPGATVSVPVILRGETNVVALQADVLFDSAAVSSGAVAAGGATANHVVTSSEPAAGIKRLLCYSLTSSPMSNGVVATIVFNVPSTALQNALRLSLSNVLLVTASPSAVPSVNGNGLIILNPIFIRPDGKTDFLLSATPGQTNVIQASTNLEQWVDLGALVPADTAVEFTDTNAPAFPYRFYRTVQR